MTYEHLQDEKAWYGGEEEYGAVAVWACGRGWEKGRDEIIDLASPLIPSPINSHTPAPPTPTLHFPQRFAFAGRLAFDGLALFAFEGGLFWFSFSIRAAGCCGWPALPA